MMREISELRSSIMRRNAQLVDWLVDHVGAVQMQLIHRKPGIASFSTPGAPSSFSPSLTFRGTP